MNNVRERLKAEREILVQTWGALIETIQGWSERQHDKMCVDLVALFDEYFTLELTYQHWLEETIDAMEHRSADGD